MSNSREIQRLDISFKDASATFKAGESVSGTVQLDLAQELKLKGIKLYFLGVSRVHWDEKRAYTKGSSARLSHRNMDSYLEETYMIMSKSDTLQPGRYSWPFNFRLPLYLPSSFDGQWGRVHYAAKVVLERPWKGDIDCTRPFFVFGLLDLNTEQDARKPTENVAESMVGVACCKSGPVMGHLSLRRRGFAIGENLAFTANVENLSKKKIIVRLVLTQLATFKANKQVRRSNSTIKIITKGELKPGQDLNWEDELKSIPIVPPSHLGGGCKTIDVKYNLTLVLAGSGKPVEVPCEIIIGTIPLRKTERLGSSTSGQGSEDRTPVMKDIPRKSLAPPMN